MRATITVHGEQGSGKTRWLGQLKAALLGTLPAEAVEVTIHESHKTVFGHGAMQFDEFTIPAADAGGSVGVTGDRETWSIVPAGNSAWHVLCGTRKVAGFFDHADAEFFLRIKNLRPNSRRAVNYVCQGHPFFFTGKAPFKQGDTPENCKGGGGEFAEGAGAIPQDVYWHDTAGNFFDYWTDRSMGGVFYSAWAPRKSEFPDSRAAIRWLKNAQFGKFSKPSAAEAPAIHDAWPTPMVPQSERDEARRDAVELRQERDALKERLANGIAHLTGGHHFDGKLRGGHLL